MRLIVPLLLFASIAAAEQPINLNALIAGRCGRAGYVSDSGCRIGLGDGTFVISETVRFGGCSTTTVRNSVILEGTSAGLMAIDPRYPTAGTTLRWAGPAGEPMIEACGSWLSFRDLTLDAKGASVGVRFTAENARSAIGHMNELRNVVIDSAEVGVHITGRAQNDMTDFVVLDHVSIQNAKIGLKQDNQQAVLNRGESLEITARKTGIEISGGAFTCETCYVGSFPAKAADEAEFIAVHLTKDTVVPYWAHHQIAFRDGHFELQRGRFFVEDGGSNFPILLEGNSYQLQCPAPGCEMLVLDSQNRGPITMISEVIQASSLASVLPRGRICHRGTGPLQAINVWKKPEVTGLAWDCAP